MNTVEHGTQRDKVAELSRLFYSFRLAQLNRKYYSRRLTKHRAIDKGVSLVVSVFTGASFAVLALSNLPRVTVVAASLAVIAFLASVAVPVLNLDQKIEEAYERVCAFHYTAQQLEAAIRFVKNCQGSDGEILGWVHSAELAYNQAAALPDIDVDDPKLIKKVEDEINASYPPNYVWTAF